MPTLAMSRDRVQFGRGRWNLLDLYILPKQKSCDLYMQYPAMVSSLKTRSPAGAVDIDLSVCCEWVALID